MKYCPRCKEKKTLESFAKNKQKIDGLQTYCRRCKVFIDHRYYDSNKSEHLKRVNNYVLSNKKMVWQYLKEHPCVDCGESNPIVLEFDHKSDKRESISYMVNNLKCSWKTVSEEIEKCDVRCANCHRIKTVKQLSWNKFTGR